MLTVSLIWRILRWRRHTRACSLSDNFWTTGSRGPEIFAPICAERSSVEVDQSCKFVLFLRFLTFSWKLADLKIRHVNSLFTWWFMLFTFRVRGECFGLNALKIQKCAGTVKHCNHSWINLYRASLCQKRFRVCDALLRRQSRHHNLESRIAWD